MLRIVNINANFKFMVFLLYMISFKSRQLPIRQADRITRSVNSIYPHISESKTRYFISKQIQKNDNDLKQGYKLSNLMLKNSNKIDSLRYKGGFGIDSFKNIISMLKEHKIGNCFEASILAQIIGKINGQKNIYPAKMYLTRNSSGATMQLDHIISIITEKPFDKNAQYKFKDKDAIVIDPWLGVTDYAGNYFKRLRTEFAKMFSMIPDNNFSVKRLALDSKNINEFKQKQKEMFKPDFYLKLYDDELVSESDTEVLKKEFPELIIKNFKPV